MVVVPGMYRKASYCAESEVGSLTMAFHRIMFLEDVLADRLGQILNPRLARMGLRRLCSNLNEYHGGEDALRWICDKNGMRWEWKHWDDETRNRLIGKLQELVDHGVFAVLQTTSFAPLLPAFEKTEDGQQITRSVQSFHPGAHARFAFHLDRRIRVEQERKAWGERNQPPTPEILEPGIGPGTRTTTLGPHVDKPGGGSSDSKRPTNDTGDVKESSSLSATSKDLAVPKSPVEAPKQVNLSTMQGDFDKQWSSSFPDGKSQEHGGTIVSDSAGKLKLVNQGSGTSGSFSPDLSVEQGEKVEGIFHTHPYDATEGSHTGISLSGGDAAYMINEKHNVILAQSGKEQFMYIRTGTSPTNVDAVTLNNAHNARIGELIGSGSSFSDASKVAAQETAKTHGLAYYEGTGGVFSRVYP